MVAAFADDWASTVRGEVVVNVGAVEPIEEVVTPKISDLKRALIIFAQEPCRAG
ncbi:MAG TPA: hypothetical protein VMU87_06510 [Stellaceae bacterium]|nr:hypothetical protein [Stellaceae bacterium]